MTIFTSSIIFRRCKNILFASIFSYTINQSILFKTRQVFTFSFQAYLSTVFVYGLTPSTTSTSTQAPSANLKALETSYEKSTWPGESIKFTRKTSSNGTLPASLSFTDIHSYFLWNIVIELLFIVMSLSCSYSRLSRSFNFPAEF